MSGQIVGEVLAAADSLRAAGVKMRAYLALIAIAEKADTGDRTASVRWGHIQSALYDRASLRTAERAVSELRAAGLVDVVRRGFNNQRGRAAAPVYRVAPCLAAVAEGLATASCGGRTRHLGGGVEGAGEPATQVAESGEGRTRQKQGANPPKQGGEPATQGGGLDVSLDVSPDVSAARARETPNLPAVPGGAHTPDVEVFAAEIVGYPVEPEPPSKYCAKHTPYGTTESCAGCMRARLAREEYERDHPGWQLRELGQKLGVDFDLAYRPSAPSNPVKACPDCDSAGWLLGADGTPVDPAERCHHDGQRRAS